MVKRVVNKGTCLKAWGKEKVAHVKVNVAEAQRSRTQVSAAQMWGLFWGTHILNGRARSRVWSGPCAPAFINVAWELLKSLKQIASHTKTKGMLWLFLFKKNIWHWNPEPSQKRSLSMFVPGLLFIGMVESVQGGENRLTFMFLILYLGYLCTGSRREFSETR
jgi:hypothetical protein